MVFVSLLISESFTNSKITEDILVDAGVCQNCFIKFNEYDEHLTMAENIQDEVIKLFEANINAGCEEKPIIKLERDDEEYFAYEMVEDSKPNNEIFLSDLKHMSDNEEDEQFAVNEWLDQEKLPKKIRQELLFPVKTENEASLTRIEKTDRDEGLKIVQLENNLKLYQCEVCSRTFKERSKLRSHSEIHTNERNVVCPVVSCGKKFKTMACLRSHKRIHNPVYVFCDHCGRFFFPIHNSRNIA